MTSSVYDLTTFKPTSHFEERALERFGITSIEIKQFLKESSPAYDTYISTAGNRIQVLSPKGIMFILNPTTKEIVTVYRSISPSIAQEQQISFQDELNQIIAKYQITTAKAYFEAVSDNIHRFNKLTNAILTTKPENLNFSLIEQVYKDLTIIKSALKLLSKQNDYYQEFNQDYDPLKYLNFDDIHENFDEPKSFKLKQQTPISETNNHNNINNNPADYTPKISNSQILKEEKPLKDILTGSEKQMVNNKLTQFGQSKLAQNVMKSIKQGITKSDLLKLTKSQLKVVDYQQFATLIGRITKK